MEIFYSPNNQKEVFSSEERRMAHKSGFVQAVALANPSVVSIQGEKQYEVQDNNGNRSGNRENITHIGMGTGVIIDERGYIITNFHVVKGLLKIQITTYDGTVYREVEFIRNDLETDLALLKITPMAPLKKITFGSSENVFLAEDVIAIGNPYGYQASVSRGIVSGLNRPLKASDTLYYENVLQTDAAINPGNSGGPLVNIDGEMIGLNAAVREGAENIAFAIPVDIVLEVADRMIRESIAKTETYGLTLRRQVDSETLSSECIVESVKPQSPAANAGLQEGDILSHVNQWEIHTPLDYTCAMIDMSALDEIKLVVGRNGKLWQTYIGFQNKNISIAAKDNEVFRQVSRPVSSSKIKSYTNKSSNTKEDENEFQLASTNKDVPILPLMEKNESISNDKEKTNVDLLWNELGIIVTPVSKQEYQKLYPDLTAISRGKYIIYPTGGVRLMELSNSGLFMEQKEKLEKEDLIFGFQIGEDEGNRWSVSSIDDLCYIAKKWKELASNPQNQNARIYLIRKNTPFFLDIKLP